MEDKHPAKDLIEELRKRIEFCKQEREKLENYLQNLKDKWLDREISYYDYEQIVNEKKNGKTIAEWFEYYKDYIKECEKRIKEQEKKIRVGKVKKAFGFLIAPILVLILISFIYFKISPVFFAPPVSETYTDDLNLVTNESLNYTWNVKNPGELLSVRISGLIEGDGNIKVYLEDLLILDSDNL